MIDQIKKTLRCSFCDKSEHEVKKLIAGPAVFICDECIVIMMDMICEEDSADLPAPTVPRVQDGEQNPSPSTGGEPHVFTIFHVAPYDDDNFEEFLKLVKESVPAYSGKLLGHSFHSNDLAVVPDRLCLEHVFVMGFPSRALADSWETSQLQKRVVPRFTGMRFSSSPIDPLAD